MMNIRVFVEVVAVLTNVVELGVYGSVVLPSAATTSLSTVTIKKITPQTILALPEDETGGAERYDQC